MNNEGLRVCYIGKHADRRTIKRIVTEIVGRKVALVDDVAVALGTRLLDDNGIVAEGTEDIDGVPADVLVLDALQNR